MKSVTKPVRLPATNALYLSRDLMYLRRNSVTKPIARPTQIAVRWYGLSSVRLRSTPTNL